MLVLNKKNEISFAKNDELYQGFPVSSSKEYKLAIAMFAGPKTIELLSFEATND